MTTIKTVKQLDELVDMGDDTTAWHQRWKLKLVNLFHQVRQINMRCILSANGVRATVTPPKWIDV